MKLGRRQWHPTPVLLPGKSHGRRSLVGCRPWGHKESDMAERPHFHFSLSYIGEGNDNPLQCSCLENPSGRAWWAAVYGVAQSGTRLKRLSSSSSSSSLSTELCSCQACVRHTVEAAKGVWGRPQDNSHSRNDGGWERGDGQVGIVPWVACTSQLSSPGCLQGWKG